MTNLNTEAMKAFEKSLEDISGNDYETYVSLCPHMEIISEAHLATPEKSAREFVALFGLDALKPDNKKSAVERELLAIQNRYTSTLYGFAASEPRQKWEMDGKGGICLVNENATLRISADFYDTDVIDPFILSSSDDFPASETSQKVGSSLSRRDFSDISFTEVKRDIDLSGFIDYISPHISQALKVASEKKPAPSPSR